MPFLLLLLLLLITLHDAWPNPLRLDPDGSCFYTLAAVGLLILAGEFVNLLTCRALRRDPGQRAAFMHRHARLKRLHLLGLVGVFLLALYVLGWGGTIHEIDATVHVPGFKVVMLAPLVAGLAIGWLRQYDVDRLNFDVLHYPHAASFPSRWAYFALQARHTLLFVLPPIILLIAHESLFLGMPGPKDAGPTLFLIDISILSVGLVVMPLFLRFFLGLTPLPDGPLRQRLIAKAHGLRFRFTDILVWNTRQGVANAMVTGVLPWLRYVVVTDRLLDELTDDEVEAVFGHEVGHMKHHHMTFYMVFILASLVLLGGLFSAFQSVAAPTWLTSLAGAAAWHTVAVWLIVAAVALYFLLVFAWLSRRCERQADIFGCKTATPAAFISALEKVADLNGIPRERPGFLSWWQHSTIADRIGFIRRMEADPALEPAFQRRLGWMKWGLAVGLVVLVVLLRMHYHWDLSKLL